MDTVQTYCTPLRQEVWYRMVMFWMESDLIDKIGTKTRYTWDNKWTYAIISAFRQKHIPISHREFAAIRERFNALSHPHDARVRHEHYELLTSKLHVLHAMRVSSRYLQSCNSSALLINKSMMSQYYLAHIHSL